MFSALFGELFPSQFGLCLCTSPNPVSHGVDASSSMWQSFRAWVLRWLPRLLSLSGNLLLWEAVLGQHLGPSAWYLQTVTCGPWCEQPS